MSEMFDRLRAALADRYALERELGRGGMATVYLARDLKHDRPVAIKVVGHDLSAQLGTERFLREIKTAAQLNHPNVLPLYDSGEAGGLLFYVMPFVEGGSLRDRLDREGQLAIDLALKVAQEVADALHHAHEQGIVHRDIKPENILFLSGRPVVADFGIARAVSAAGGDQMTQTGMAVGTPAYMSPEQAAGDPNVDGRSDIYALGCVLYEMLSGHPPFMGRNPREIIARHTMDAVPPLRTARPTISDHLDQTVTRALAKVPADRFATARELSEALAGRLAARTQPALSRILEGLIRGKALAVVGGYAAFTLVVWLLMGWVASRFSLSPHLPTFALAALGFLLPAAAVVGYRVGNRGVRWRAVHTAGVSANVVVAAVALLGLFGGKDLGAATVAVTLTDEEGTSVQRRIPKAEFRKRLGIFYFDADSADRVARDLAYGIPEALAIDLLQDLYIDLRSPASFRDRLREEGRRDLTGVSLSLAREIASEQWREHFVKGTVRTDNGEIVVTMTVYETASGNIVSRSEVRGSDPLAMVDQLTTDILGEIKVPEGYAGKAPDLPAAEVLTGSRAAFGYFAQAQEALVVQDDWPRAAELLEQAVAEDPDFAFAQYELYIVYVYQNRAQEGRGALQVAVDRSFRLPERMRNQVKANYYEMRREPDKMYAVIEMNAELFPTDVQALGALIQIQAMRGQRREAIATAQRILAVDPNQHDYLRAIADLHQSLGESDQAIEHYRRYTELNPNDRRGFRGLGSVRESQGDHAGAREAYARMGLLDPGDVTATLDLADLDLAIGEFDRARNGYENALRDARTGPDSIAVFGGLARFHAVRGQIRDGLRYQERAWDERAKIGPPIQVMIDRLRGLGDYIAAGDTARGLALLEEWGGQLQPPFDAFRPLGDLDVALELEQPDRIDSAAAAMERVVDQFSYEFLRPAVVFARGQAHYLRAEFREAIANWERERELRPGNPTVPRQLGQAYRGLRDFRKAEETLNEARRIRPADPRTFYEIALLDEARGRRADAITNLRAALEIWADADPSYKWARRAREKLTELEGAR